jgi:hypothetical protein
VEYIATDERNEELPWVRYTNNKTGETIIYRDEDNPLADAQIDTSKVRIMDCMDCHNRPSHLYRPPAFFVNEAITAGLIPKELPGIKALAMEICSEDFSTSDSAIQYIDQTIREYYQSDYPEIIEQQKEFVDKASQGLQQIFSQNIFPEMKVKWSAYPNHIGHMEFNGCFRCHNDTHASEDGQIIRKDCNLCHGIDAQGRQDEMEFATTGGSLEFKHPLDIDEAWKEGLCTDCHTGLNP